LTERNVTEFLERPLWHWSELAFALDIPAPAGGPDISGISIDSRSLQTGELFIALAGDPGERFHTSSPGNRDGHSFLTHAQAKGAAGALVARTQPCALPQLRVSDTLDGLWALAAAAVKRHVGRRIAITGSSGKTTAKAFLAAALDAVAQPGSLNNFWGVPLCLARTPRSAGWAVYEIGTNRAGEIEPLSTLAQPDVALLLNVHPAHLGNFSSFDSLREEKISINRGLKDKTNLVCEYSVATRSGLAGRAFTFGEAPQAAVRLLSQEGQSAVLDTPQGLLDVHVPGGGRHRALTLAAVVATLIRCGESPERAAKLPDSLVPPGRGNEQLIQRSSGAQASWTLIDDSYNANPASMAAALRTLGEGDAPGVAVLGEMLELGESSASYHLDLVPHCEALAGVYCVGKGMRGLFDALPQAQRLGYVDNAADIVLDELVSCLPSQAHVLVKGSNRVFWQTGFVDRLAAAMRGSVGDEKKTRQP